MTRDGIRVIVDRVACPSCGGAVDLVHGPGQGVSAPHATAYGGIVQQFTRRPFWSCTACEWCEEAN